MSSERIDPRMVRAVRAAVLAASNKAKPCDGWQAGIIPLLTSIRRMRRAFGA